MNDSGSSRPTPPSQPPAAPLGPAGPPGTPRNPDWDDFRWQRERELRPRASTGSRLTLVLAFGIVGAIACSGVTLWALEAPRRRGPDRYQSREILGVRYLGRQEPPFLLGALGVSALVGAVGGSITAIRWLKEGTSD